MRYVLTSDEIKSVGIVDEWDWEEKKRKNQNKTKQIETKKTIKMSRGLDFSTTFTFFLPNVHPS